MDKRLITTFKTNLIGIIVSFLIIKLTFNAIGIFILPLSPLLLLLISIIWIVTIVVTASKIKGKRSDKALYTLLSAILFIGLVIGLLGLSTYLGF